MALPDPLQALVLEREFWDWYFFETGGGDRLRRAGCSVRFCVDECHGLTLYLDEGWDSYRLDLFSPSAPGGIEIACEAYDPCDPHVLRWDELDLLGRCVALRDPSLPHPGLVVALLSRFAPICVGDNVDVIHPLLEGAIGSLGLFSAREIGRYLERCDSRQGGLVWRSRVPGWCMEQDEAVFGFYLSTRRTRESEGFPFQAMKELGEAARSVCRRAVQPVWLRWDQGTVERLAREIADSGDLTGAPVLADALDEAGCRHPTILNALRPPLVTAQACWAIELLVGLEPGMVIARHFGPTSRPLRMVHRFNLDIPVLTSTFELPGQRLAAFIQAIHHALDTADLGGACLVGSQSGTGTAGRPSWRTMSISVTIRGDREEGLALVRQTLLPLAPPDGTQLRLAFAPYTNIPLEPIG